MNAISLNRFLNLPRFLSSHIFCMVNPLRFRLRGIKLGQNSRIHNKVYIQRGINASIEIGNDFVFTSDSCFNPLCRNIRGCIVAYPYAKIAIGNNVGISSACIWAYQSIKIGNNVNIGGDVIIMDSDCHSLNYLNRREERNMEYSKYLQNVHSADIVIEDDCLIGARSIILKGVHIGARSIIGAGSIVVKDVPADSIAAGNPCKVIKQLTSK